MEEFGILMDDGSEVTPDLVIEENTKTVELYDWQRNAINYFFNHNYKAIFEICTGGGKTFCAIEIIKKIWEEDPNCKVLIVVPKNVILETGWYKELYDAGISLKDIGVFYGSIKEICKVTITNMHSLEKIPMELFDCIIFDEIHNYATKRLLPYVYLKKKYKIGLSATLERMDNAHYKLLEAFEYNRFTYSPSEALRDGVLNPFNFYNISVHMDGNEREEYTILTEQINRILLQGGGYGKIMYSKSGLRLQLLSKMGKRKELVNNYYKKFDVVQQIVKKHRNDKIIIFNEYNKQTSKSYWYLLESGVRACVVHSDMPKEKREQNLIDFKNDKFNVILASKVLDEGYNLPKIDVALIVAGNSTSRQTIQRMGRVLRKKEHDSNLYQIYCKDTIEEDYANERSKLFKGLCSRYDEYHFNNEKMVIE